MKIAGITGGIGSGKSVVSRIFQSLGIPVFNSDFHAKRVYEDYPETMEFLKARYGGEIIRDGKPDRAKLASIVFGSETELKALNALIHPFVRKQFEQWVRLQDAPYVLREAAILLESDTYHDCDAIILVSAPLPLRIARVVERDKTTDAEVLARVKRQWTDEQKRAFSDFEIINDDVQAILPQVLAIHETLIRG